MFIRVTVALEQVDEATIVPEQALTTRADHTGVFVVDDDGKAVTWREVRVGIREGNRVQVEGEGLTGRVVTLGQQLVNDGSAITIPVP
jgi:multidrug efflux pump subunit AcrA (membrane-fusion protein)